MPLYDMECTSCNKITEVIAGINETTLPCPHCGAQTKRIISASGRYCANDDSDWVRSVLEVVSKDSTEHHVVEFRNNPNRTTLKAWLKGQGLRHMESGEEIYKKRPPMDMTRHHEKVYEALRRDDMITVRSK